MALETTLRSLLGVSMDQINPKNVGLGVLVGFLIVAFTVVLFS